MTIIAKNRLAHARVLMESVSEWNPDFARFALLIDEPEGLFDPSAETFTIISSERLGLDRSKWLHFKYSILELSTALKPFFIRWLFRNYEFDRIIYLDPDVRVYSSLAGIEATLDSANIALTPHLTVPLEDDRQPNELQILRAGAYNLGFIGVRASAETDQFLSWWQSRLYDYCVVDLPRGLFVDQRWMDLVPGMFPGVSILRDAAYNAAYWNAAHRDIVSRHGRPFVASQPLCFFHFSGYDPQKPATFSEHQDRIQFCDRPDLEALCEDYGTELARHGFATCIHWPYTHGRFRNGCVIPDAGRHLVEEAPDLVREIADPFSDEGCARIVRFWNEPVSSKAHGGVTRLAYRVYRLREDVQAAMPDIFGADYVGFLRWMLSKAPHEHLLSEPFLTTVRAAAMKNRLDGESALETEALHSQEADRSSSCSHLTVLARYIYQSRPDLQRIFPDPEGRHETAFLAWLLYYGRDSYSLSEECLAPLRASLGLIQDRLSLPSRLGLGIYTLLLKLGLKVRPLMAAARRRSTLMGRRAKAEPGPAVFEPTPVTAVRKRAGVNLYGYFRAETGVGQSVRNGMSALASAGFPTAVRNLTAEGQSESGASVTSISGEAPYDTSIFFVNADQTKIAHRRLRGAPARHRIGVWTWELEDLPAIWDGAFEEYDEIWAPSSFCQAALAARSPVPVVRIPYCVRPANDNGRTRKDFGIDPKRFVFLSIFDMRSGFARKNPLGAMAAFRQAFGKRNGVELIVKVNHADSSTEAMDRLRHEAGDNIRLIEDTFRYEDISALMRCSDCVVSLHRAEGFGLVLAEAMWLEKPVVATAYSGNLDFTLLENAYLVPFELRPVGPGNAPYPETAHWAEPNIERAAEQIRLVYENPTLRAQRAAAGRRFVRDRFSAEAVGAAMAVRIELLRSRGRSQVLPEIGRREAAGSS